MLCERSTVVKNFCLKSPFGTSSSQRSLCGALKVWSDSSKPTDGAMWNSCNPAVEQRSELREKVASSEAEGGSAFRRMKEKKKG